MVSGGELAAIYMPSTTATIEGVPAGLAVEATLDPGGSGRLGAAGMDGDDFAQSLSFTVELNDVRGRLCNRSPRRRWYGRAVPYAQNILRRNRAIHAGDRRGIAAAVLVG